MARGVNKVILVGRLGEDPSVKYLPSGSAVANISIATTEQWKDKNSGEKQERVEWHRIVLFARLAEIVGEYCRKGTQVYIEGKLQTRKWQAKDGSDRYTTEIVANEMQMLGSGSGAQDAGRNGQSSAQASAYGGGPSESATPTSGAKDFEDDIPFAPLSGTIY